jgi:adenosine deaminase
MPNIRLMDGHLEDTAAPATADYLRRLPKAELHCHFEGSIPAMAAIELAERNGVTLPTDDPSKLYSFETLEEFLAVYVQISQAMKTPTDFAELTYACLTEAATSGGLRYREMAFNPTNHPDLTYSQILAGMLDGVRSAEADTGVECRLIAAINREQPASVALDLVRDVIAHRCDEVIGIGLDHNELAGPPGAFTEAYALAAQAGLYRTAHAGERGVSAEIEQSVDLLGVQRIDHGYAVLLDPALVSRAAAEGWHFATCWSTCLLYCDGDPARSEIGPMIDAGLSVSINSDDPPMFGTDIGQEFVLAGAAFGWTPAQAAEQALAGLEGAFLDDADRARLVGDFRWRIAELEAIAPAD